MSGDDQQAAQNLVNFPSHEEIIAVARIKEVIDEAYSEILDVALTVLRNCHFSRLSIQILQDDNPTYAEIAKTMEEICDFMKLVSDAGNHDVVYSYQKAKEYANHVRCIADAIDANDDELLHHHFNALNARSFL